MSPDGLKSGLLYLAVSAWLLGSTSMAAFAGTTGVPPEIRVVPTEIVLDRPGTSQQVVVQAVEADGRTVDLTSRAQFRVENAAVARVDAAGTVRPGAGGVSRLIVSREGRRAASVPVRVREGAGAYRWDFRVHVAPLLSRLGCNGTSCHGSAAGKGGFRLSGFGHDPEMDYRSIVREGSGRRINRAMPGASLVLMKPTLAISHGGGLRLKEGSAEYRQLAGWLAAGAPLGPEARTTRVEVAPSRVFLSRRGERHRILAIAHYEDGTREDVTRSAAWESRDEEVARLESGSVVAVGTGETPILARFGGHSGVAVAGATLTPVTAAAAPIEEGIVDREIFSRLRRLGIRPAPPADDFELCRRLYLDLIGRIPTAEELQSFAGEEVGRATSPDRSDRSDGRHRRLRVERFVDSLLAGPEFARNWRDVLNAHLMGRTAFPVEGAWGAWLEKSLAADRPWDSVVRELVAARAGAGDDAPAAQFLDRRFSIGDTGLDLATRDVSRLFFGVDIQCARCHVHPDVTSWHQEAYWGIAAFLGRTYRIQVKNVSYLAERATGEVEYFGPDREKHPARPRTLQGDLPEEKPDLKEDAALYSVPPEEAKEKTRVPVPLYSRREALVRLAVRPEDGYFRRGVVNWIWSQLMGRGLVEPVDQMHPGNPATHPVLLERLADDFVRGGLRLKGLIREIVTSRAYGLASEWSGPERPKAELYAVFQPRPIPIPQLANSLLVAAGYWPQRGETPARDRFESATSARAAELRKRLDPGTEHFQPGTAQALYMTNSTSFGELLTAGGAPAALARDEDDAHLIQRAFLEALSRPPGAEEVLAFRQHMETRKNRREEAARQVLWALLASAEFRLNH